MTVVTPEHRRRLTEVRQRTSAARQRQSAARRAIDLAGSDLQVRQHAEAAFAQAGGELSLAQELEGALLGQMAGISGGGFDSPSFLDDPATVRTLEQLSSSSMPVGSLALGPMMSPEDLVSKIESGGWGSSPRMAAADPVLPDAARVTVPYGVIPQLRRKLTLLDLIPTSTMEGKSFTYARESGSFDTAAETVELALKPVGDDTLLDFEVVAKTIAHFNKIAKQQLADVPALGVTLQARLLYGVLRRLENQILAGDGVGENLTGILNTTGIASVPFVVGTPLTDLSLTGIVDVLLGDAQPNAVVIHPSDWAKMLTAKATGSGEYLSDQGPFGMDPNTLWGLPVISSKALAVGTALVGDFTQGCTLYIREAPNVRISDSDQDDFIRNRVTTLAEMRAGIAIWQPAAFCEVHLA